MTKQQTEVYSTEKITCRRCAGKGYVGSHVVYAGAPGGCYSCMGYGEVYKDKFYRAFGVGKKFYGVTGYRYCNEGNPNNGVTKRISTEFIEPMRHMSMRGKVLEAVTCVEITEEQARKFWARYGREVRVADFDGDLAA